MKCVYCAEEIQEEARLCRFCGAKRVGEQWQPPGPRPSQAAGKNLTLLTSGWLLLLSGAWMLFHCASPVPLFGALRGGVTAVLYNGALALSFAAMGYALLAQKPWALTATALATALYTVDKLLFLLDAQARRALLAQSTALLQALGPDLDLGDMADRLQVLLAWAFLAGWWGLVLYIYLKRSYFRRPASLPE